MGISVGGNRGIFVEMNVVPLIDVLLVLLVIFMIIPHKQSGMTADLPQPANPVSADPPPAAIVIQVLADGSLRINQESVAWDGLRARLEQILGSRANRTAFVRGDSALEFQVVAKVIDTMRAAGVRSVGLMTPGLEKLAETD
ncbi:MAG TPA: biopolymer transporter ExbD [Candidatus Saccharimonadales bacterium]|jgi:biopolymer transport protein TolR|nr:biopolymer transporter ExbD [Candidatus Saccharimonadales bacterium]